MTLWLATKQHQSTGRLGQFAVLIGAMQCFRPAYSYVQTRPDTARRQHKVGCDKLLGVNSSVMDFNGCCRYEMHTVDVWMYGCTWVCFPIDANINTHATNPLSHLNPQMIHARKSAARRGWCACVRQHTLVRVCEGEECRRVRIIRLRFLRQTPLSFGRKTGFGALCQLIQ